MIQLQILNKILDTRDSSIITLNNLNIDYFSDYKEEFLYIKDHIQKYDAVPDRETFLSVFPDFEIITVNEPDNFLLGELTNDKNKRFLAANFNQIRNLIMNNDVEEAMQILRQAANDSADSVSLQCVDILKDRSRYDAYVERTEDYDKYFIKTGFDELDKIIGGWDTKEELATIVARNGLGKCLEKGTKVLMADGTTKKVEDIKVGDKVQSLNQVNTVLALHSGKSIGYKIIPKLGDPFTVSDNHILTLMKRNIISRKGEILHTSDNTFTLVDMKIEDYLNLSSNQKRQYELYRPEVNYPEKDLKIPPYILGLWLGDGTSCRVSLTNADPEIVDEWKKWGYKYTDTIREDKLTYDITNKDNKGKTSEILNIFRSYNLLNNKHIPLDYLTGNKTQRLELLAGIIDSDGYLTKKYRTKSNTVICYYSICLKSKLLIEQIAQLARGLNFRVGSIKERILNNKVKGLTSYYTISIFGSNICDIPCRLKRKQAVKSSSQRYLSLTSFKVESVPEIEYYGFMADGDHRYLLADNTLTHNTWALLKCAAAAAKQGKRVGIYSGEMSENKVGYRIDTLLGHISNGSLVHGNAGIKNQYKNYLDTIEEEVPGSIFILTPKMINGPAGVSALRAFVEKYNIEILFIDQHSLLEDDHKAKSPVEKASNISKDLKLLQVIKRIPIISVCQQNREKLEDKGTFDTTQLAQSDRIAQDSTIIIFIERDKDLFKLHLVKSRDTENGAVLTYKVDLNQGYFQFIPSGEEASSNDSCDYSEDEVF